MNKSETHQGPEGYGNTPQVNEKVKNEPTAT